MTHQLIDTNERRLNYLRVSITDRCNLNCLYCRRWGVTPYFPASEILTYEEILRIINIGSLLGITKVRITGGEPFVRNDAGKFIERVGDMPMLTDVSVTTNGLRLESHLSRLKDSGIKRINVSLDTLKIEKYRLITGRDGFRQVWRGIMAALEAGFDPVKINVVVMRDINDDELASFARLTLDMPVTVRFIEYMPTCEYQLDQYRKMFYSDIRSRVEANGKLIPVRARDNSNNAERFKYPKAKGEIGFINPMSRHFCAKCNRLRLTADGKIRPCLLSDRFVDIKTPMRQGCTDSEIAGLLQMAAFLKPKSSIGAEDKIGSVPAAMSAIGG
ncbi:MAG: GTP 3',8-cyclase MoaA [Thermodesulfobacteriota bacterium]|nr:GTP 3',8-cyclase MoaA [Thermodesulfobacteriota bacterium]